MVNQNGHKETFCINGNMKLLITGKYYFVKRLDFIFKICEFHYIKKLTSIKEEGMTNVLQMVYPGTIILFKVTSVLHKFTHAFRTYLLCASFVYL